MTNLKKISIAIDASNLRSGGGLTHIIEFLVALNNSRNNIEKVEIWGSNLTLKQIKKYKWLTKSSLGFFDKNLFLRIFWQTFILSRSVRARNFDILFVPGGSYSGNFHPVVTMSRNLLPFESSELTRYGLSVFTIKLICLRFVQLSTFRRVDGLIFLTNYAKKIILGLTKINSEIQTISHGINPRFRLEPRKQYKIEIYTKLRPYRILYVSTIDFYKHQVNLIRAIARLRIKGMNLELNLIGGSYKPALKILEREIKIFDPKNSWIKYKGPMNFNDLHTVYKNSELGVFASSCENMPNILIEMMASGLPIACSNRGPMPEILGDSGLYFNPEDIDEITDAIDTLVTSPGLREKLSKLSYKSSQQYSWPTCAKKTFAFIHKIAHKKGNYA